MRTTLGLHGALAVLAVVAAAVAAPARAGDEADRAASPVASIAVEGTVLKITLADGRVLASRDLIGASLLIDQGDRLRRVRLDGIERDPDDKRRDVAPADVIWLHSFAVEGPDGAWGPLCEDGPDGRRQAISVAGRFSYADGRLGAGEPGSFELACTAGAMGKCVRFGYHPWQTRNLPQPVSTASRCLRSWISSMRASAWSGPTTAATAQALPGMECSSTSMTTTASRHPTSITA